jgi:hypothetical protein
VKSVRQQLIQRFPPPPREIEADDQLGHALYRMLWSLGDPDVSVDGWTVFKLTRECDASLDGVGLMTLLPSGSMPIAVHVEAADDAITWSARASLRDETWLSLSDSKRWNKVYLYAGGDLAVPQWKWDRTYTGTLAPPASAKIASVPLAIGEGE